MTKNDLLEALSKIPENPSIQIEILEPYDEDAELLEEQATTVSYQPLENIIIIK